MARSGADGGGAQRARQVRDRPGAGTGEARMINTPTSGLWWDVSGAPSPERAAVPLLDLALGPVDPGHHGELARFGRVLPWRPEWRAEWRAAS
ncbi:MULTISPECIES: hypothetical protein [unclassified Nonomuraea]|uniref:hypothetical protein n=1 Tax=unclassified Nonomuraea TaxID=2593643 RepID=UPI0033E524C8